jgi:hypothetical protein
MSVFGSNKVKLSYFEWLVLAGVVLLFIFYIKSKGEIINYPDWLLYSCVSIVSLVILFFRIKKAMNDQSKFKALDRILFWGLFICTVLVPSYFIGAIILIPFNYYNIEYARNNSTVSERCEITGVSLRSRPRCVFYKFHSRTNMVNGYIPIMQEVSDSKRYKDYEFVVDVRRGLLNSFVMDGWTITHK